MINIYSIEEKVVYRWGRREESMWQRCRLRHTVLMEKIRIKIWNWMCLGRYRRNIFQVYLGDASETPRRDRSQYKNYIARNVHLADYLIGNLLWGLLVIVFVLFAFSLVIHTLIIFQARQAIESIPHSSFQFFSSFLLNSIWTNASLDLSSCKLPDDVLASEMSTGQAELVTLSCPVAQQNNWIISYWLDRWRKMILNDKHRLLPTFLSLDVLSFYFVH